MGEQFEGGFVLEQPNIQVFERKPKEPKEPTAAATTSGNYCMTTSRRELKVARVTTPKDS
jgi:hypothetical protein